MRIAFICLLLGSVFPPTICEANGKKSSRTNGFPYPKKIMRTVHWGYMINKSFGQLARELNISVEKVQEIHNHMFPPERSKRGCEGKGCTFTPEDERSYKLLIDLYGDPLARRKSNKKKSSSTTD